jgi:penicillin-binding protein 2
MSPHGTLTLTDAIKYSCNAFFYQWGNKAGIDQIDAMGDALGLGHRTGLPLSGESPGVVPGPAWLARISPTEKWTEGYTANVSIGQGACEASPLQMAMVVSTIANRGISFEPRLVNRIVDQNGQDARDEDGKLVCPPEPKVRANLREAGVTEDQIELVRRGMWKVVNDPGGTGKKASVKGVEVAGKTGTAQFWREVHGKKEKDNHTWFICFAPYKEPRYAICIMVEGGKSGGGTSAPIAHKILEESLAVENGYDPGIVPLEPAVGHFKPIMEVTYPNSEKLPVGAADPDEQPTDHADDSTPSDKREKQVRAAPDIRDEPDARGRINSKRPVAPPAAEKKNFFQRFFGPRNPQPAPAPPLKPFNNPGRPR